jgi:hypothetical protein
MGATGAQNTTPDYTEPDRLVKINPSNLGFSLAVGFANLASEAAVVVDPGEGITKNQAPYMLTGEEAKGEA